MKFFEIWLAFRYLHSKKHKAFISIVSMFSFIGIMLGVATLIVVMSVMHGYREEFLKLTFGFEGHISLHSYGSHINNSQEILDKIKELEHVKSAIMLVEKQALVSANDKSIGVRVRGIDLEDLIKNKPLVVENIVNGDIQSLNNESYIALGGELARMLHVKAGDTVSILAPEGMITMFGMIPTIKEYIVGAVFSTGLHVSDLTTIFINRESAGKFYNIKDNVNIIELSLDNPFFSKLVTDKLYSMLDNDIMITDWQESNAQFLHALDVERAVMFMILTLIILIAAFNIISSLTMLVQEKNKAIAILHTMGASSGSILRIFMFCGMSIGLAGTILGTILGVGFAANIDNIRHFLETYTHTRLFDPIVYYLTYLPAIIDIKEVLKISCMSLAVSILATFYPALQASRQDPIAILRYEA